MCVPERASGQRIKKKRRVVIAHDTTTGGREERNGISDRSSYHHHNNKTPESLTLHLSFSLLLHHTYTHIHTQPIRESGRLLRQVLQSPIRHVADGQVGCHLRKGHPVQ